MGATSKSNMQNDELKRLGARLRNLAGTIDSLEDDRDEYLLAIRNIYVRIRKWCEPLVRDRVLKIRDTSIAITGDNVGDYDAPAIDIVARGTPVIRLRPKGMAIVSAFGRIDMTCCRTSVVIVAEEKWKWKFSELDRGYGLSTTPVTKTSFFRTVNELLPDNKSM